MTYQHKDICCGFSVGSHITNNYYCNILMVKNKLILKLKMIVRVKNVISDTK